ncbi:glycoside hydrolase family 43 protein [Umezawaea sp. Da 62-37]|uniref:glycoside hydrolase family 43 protein n=1 Tax=Umezawaea sp. Da 62-37 TaxID=3075927 RepID=UPI0028F738D3|nr:glycoside hydrolase family 43 protein [Umezawaea sp. Da 62-37]WNV88347.1 glycoside hydrolase family 43 protein [Umezawaea sp. Da 62-37]
MRAAVLALALLASAIAVPSAAARDVTPRAMESSRYTMTAFTNSSESNMYVYRSTDGANFDLAKGPAYTPPSGLIRDPSIMKHTDGRYYLAYTTGWTGNTIGLARSDNQVDWTFLRNITLPTANLTRTWAPEWFTDSDGSVHLVVSLSVDGGATFRPHELRALDSGLSSWSTPAPLNGLGPNYIDTFVVKIGSTYHAFVKNETTKYIEYATATSLTGAYTFRGTGNWAGWGSTLEGPALVKLDNGGWRLYFDAYSSGHYYSTDSHDGFASWTAKADLPGGLSGFVRHLTVLREPSGTPPALTAGTKISLRSNNFPDRYVRHRDFLGYVDVVNSASPLATRQDATFTVRAGLADADCYSFESVNPTGRYLRHYDYKVRLDASDGTAVFRGDATFCARPGLSGSGASLESFNRPGMYVRHQDYALRVDQYQATGTLKADGSFTLAAPLS